MQNEYQSSLENKLTFNMRNSTFSKYFAISNVSIKKKKLLIWNNLHKIITTKKRSGTSLHFLTCEMKLKISSAYQRRNHDT